MDWRKQVEDFQKEMKVVQPSEGRMLFRFATFGAVGSGKSVTSCIVAIAATPPPGLIGIVDGENSRSKIAVDEAARLAVEKYGGTRESFMAKFKVIHIDPPFNPLRVIAAGEALLAAGCHTLILDILTQCWDASGGYLDMKEEVIERMTDGDDRRRQKVAQAAAARVKPWTHNKLVHWIDECKASMILCFQAKQKWNPQTKQIDAVETPIQETGITRTAVAVARIYAEGGQSGFCDFTCLPGQTKYTSVELLRLLPSKQQLTFDHAEKMVKWFNTRGGTAAPQAAQTAPVATPDPEKERLKQRGTLAKQLTVLLADIHKCPDAECKTKEDRSKRTGTMEGWLLSKAIVKDGESLSTMTPERLAEVVTLTERTVNETIAP